jgi:hypothetical protein
MINGIFGNFPLLVSGANVPYGHSQRLGIITQFMGFFRIKECKDLIWAGQTLLIIPFLERLLLAFLYPSKNKVYDTNHRS